MLLEYDQFGGQLGQDYERSRSPFMKKYLAGLRIDLLWQSFYLTIIWSRLYFGLRFGVLRNRGRVVMSSHRSSSA